MLGPMNSISLDTQKPDAFSESLCIQKEKFEDRQFYFFCLTSNSKPKAFRKCRPKLAYKSCWDAYLLPNPAQPRREIEFTWPQVKAVKRGSINSSKYGLKVLFPRFCKTKTMRNTVGTIIEF